MTRCKPGDLAAVVRVNQRSVENCIGALIRVTVMVPNSRTGQPCWHYEGPLKECLRGRPIIGFDDDELRPITPPPGAVTDDEVAELYDPRELVLVTRERA